MVVSTWKQNPINVKVRREKINGGKEFKYLGGLITQEMEEARKTGNEE